MSGPVWLTVAIVVAGAMLVWWVIADGSNGFPGSVGVEGREIVTTEPSADDEVESSELRSVSVVANGTPTPHAVVADPKCRMVVGQRTESDIALVILPIGEGAWFALVDADGVEFDGTLPFVPEQLALGKRGDGTILAGFGFEGEVQIVHDGRVIYELDDAWEFDIANDGSSFFVVEPMAGEASRLVVRNLDLRQEHHFDMGTTIVRADTGLDYVFSYSDDLAEVAATPASGRGGVNRFYPAVGGEHREVIVEGADTAVPRIVSLFESSRMSYHVYNEAVSGREPSQRWTIFKVQRDFSGGSANGNVLWTHDLVAIGPLSIHLSEDRALVLLSGAVSSFVLRTTDGKRVFSYPPRRRMIARMPDGGSRVYPPRDEEGRRKRMSGRFVGNRAFFHKWIEGKPEEAMVVDEFELAPDGGSFRMVAREVKRTPDDSDLNFSLRTELDPRNPTSCTDHAFLDHRLEIRDGRLTYHRDAG
ncbi:MAG: hypothetical protein OXQ90_17095 [Gammaproteobacteria bacterium]|nr:hypothetical protein [Gammaproteobacteria bacterium]